MLSKLLLASAICVLAVACSTQTKNQPAQAAQEKTTPRVPSNDQVSMEDLIENRPNTHGQVGKLKDYRVVIPGILYRGGNSGNGQASMLRPELEALAKEGFSAATYMYPQYGFDKSLAKATSVDYAGFGPGVKDRASIHNFLSKVKDIIENKKGPMYVHCWNGWHASGEMATYALMQFCGMDGQTGLKYWNNNVRAGKGTVKRIGSFQTFSDLKISAEDAARICPR